MAHFPFDFDRRFIAIWWPLGAREGRDGVTINDGNVVATYGRFAVRTTVDNVTSTQVSGPYNPLKAVGLRLSMADSGLTMGTGYRSGVCLTFATKVDRVIGWRDHRGLTVTVADPDGLVAAIEAAR